VRALASSTCLFGQDDVKTIVDYLENIPTFTHVLAPEFSAYTTYSEEDNTNSIQLTEPIHLFGPRVKLITGTKSSALLEQEPDFCIPERTTGRMVSEPNQPKVAMWYHSYSGFKYLAKLLETFLAAADQIDATTGESADPEAVTEIITTFALILNGLSKSPDAVKSRQEASRILQLASLGLNRNRDIISVVFDIFEEELQRQSVNVGSEEPLELLTSCLQFIHALIWISPGRVWPFIGRSGLLDLGRGSSKLSTIVGGIELVTGRYDFLLSCTVLFGALVEDLALNTVSRRCKSKSSKRFDGSDDMAGTGVPDQVLSKVLLSFTRFLVDAFESSCTWKFFDQDDCRQLRKNIAGTFVKILHHAYGIEESIAETVDSTSEQTTPKPLVSKLAFSDSSIPKKKPKIMAAFEPAAQHITDSFLSISSGSLRVQPILQTFYDALEAPDSTFHLHESSLCVEQVQSVLSFSKTILQVSTLLGRPSSQLELQLFKASPLIARLYAVNDAYRIPVVALFESLVVSVSINTTEPPSLLGYLGQRTSQNRLDLFHA